MFGKKNKKSPAGQLVADSEARKASMRAQEDKQMMYAIGRTIYEMYCIGILLEEIALLNATEASIEATVTRRPFPEGESESRRKYMLGRLKDFHLMSTAGERSRVLEVLDTVRANCDTVEEFVTREPEVKEEPASAILDSAGNPISPDANKDVLQEEQTTA